MALRKANQEAVAAATEPFEQASPAFEAPEKGADFVSDYVAAETKVAEPEVASPEINEAAAEVARNAIAKAKTTAVGAARKLVGAFSDLQNVIALEDVEAMGVGAFPRVTVDLGGFMLDKEEIGSEIKIELLSWNFRYMVTTGSNDEEAKKKVKVSYDGETIVGTGESVKSAVEAFKEEGYEDAECKGYADLWGSLAVKSGKEIDEADRPIVQVQLSPESLKKFKAFQTEVGFKQARGLLPEGNILITIKANRGEWKGNRYGFCTFSLAK